jgi:hypothetical protein
MDIHQLSYVGKVTIKFAQVFEKVPALQSLCNKPVKERCFKATAL